MMRPFVVLAVLSLPLLAAPAYADCTDDIRAALMSVSSSGPYRMVGTSADKDMSLEVFSEIVPPNAMYLRNEADGFFNEVIVRDGRAWSGNGQDWVELDDATAQELSDTVSEHALSNFEGLANVECLGAVEENGASLLAYSLGLADGEKNERAEVRVDPDTGRPVHIRVVGMLDGRKNSADMRITYDPKIRVALPPGF